MIRSRLVPIAVALLASGATLNAQAVLRPSASGRATSEVTVSYPRPAAGPNTMPGMAMSAQAAAPAAVPPPKPLVIRVDYGQPHLRGRTLHTDSLVPYDKAWRLGANSSTTLTTDVDLVVGGASLPRGSYVLYTIPGRTGWKLVIQRSEGQSAMQFDDKLDVARVNLRHTTLPMSVESLTMWLIPSLEPGAARGELRMAWGTDQLSADWQVK